MRRRTDVLIPLLTVLLDALMIEGAFLLSYWLRFDSALTKVFPVTQGIPPLSAYVIGSAVIIPLWLWIFMNRGLYRPRRCVDFSDEFFAVVRVVAVGMLVVLAGVFFYREFSFSRLVFGLLAVCATLLLTAGRYGMLKFEQWWYGRGNDLKRVIVVGAHSLAADIARRVQTDKRLGYRLVGYFSEAPSQGMTDTGAEHLGNPNAVANFIRTEHIDIVLIALPESEHPALNDLVRACEGLQAEMMMVPDLVELLTSQVRIRHIAGIPFLGIKTVALSAWNQIVKRSFDLLISAIILILVSPILLLIALLVKLESRGPVFYKQERVGLDGNLFNVLKFRSMRLDAEANSGPVWAQKNDPRATRVGRFLRRFSLDELPQLINVLRGDMSLVGPRPERQHFVDQFKAEIPKYLERHRVKTGMTGWAQVNGLRGNAPISERTKYDVYYVENWSLVFDLKIIFKTLRAVLFGEDAY